MKKFLLLDFGASRIKASLLIGNKISNAGDYPSIKPCNTKNKCFEVPALKIKEKFLEIIEQYYKICAFDGILICSEMHGFVIADKKNSLKSNYISWKSERSTFGDNCNFNKLSSKIKDIFFKKTGMNLRACYPIFNLHDMVQNKETDGGKIISLPDWLACAGGKSENKTHITMAAGLGFYDIHKNRWDEDLIKELNCTLEFNEVVNSVEIGGYITLNGKEIPIYTGVGDHQCAVLGAKNDDNSISVNLGTGSQVAMINLNNNNCEKRPYFDNKMLSVITHIPSGRMLNTFIGFMQTANCNVDWWEKLGKISLSAVKNSDLSMDLSIFKSAWNYKAGGVIAEINENNFTADNYLASLLKNYIIQYKNAIEVLKPDKKYNKIIMSGGIPAKLPVFIKYLDLIMNKKYEIYYKKPKYDETLEGLKIISEKI